VIATESPEFQNLFFCCRKTATGGSSFFGLQKKKGRLLHVLHFFVKVETFVAEREV